MQSDEPPNGPTLLINRIQRQLVVGGWEKEDMSSVEDTERLVRRTIHRR
jgi:hypothetical protein